MIELGYRSPADAANIRQMCKEDLLFFVNTFLFLFEPRNKFAKVVPFITRDYQDVHLLEVYDAIGDHDLPQPKSREMGATWSNLVPCLHYFLFSPYSYFTIMSYKEELVDGKGPKPLFAKLDHMLNPKWFPAWLRPRMDRTFRNMENLDNGSVFIGDTTTERSAVGDRALAVLIDELSRIDATDAANILRATQFVTKCRLMPYTAWTVDHPSTQLAQDPDKKKLFLHWMLDKDKAAGAYYAPTGKSKTGPDGWRSPYYDEECRRARDDLDVARDLDIRFEGSETRFFDDQLIKRVVERDCKKPVWSMQVRAFLDWDEEGEHEHFWRCMEGTQIDLWVMPDRNGRLPVAEYVIGVDTATGNGDASDSALVAYRKSDRMKVLQFVCNRIRPHEMAHLVNAIGKWLVGPYDGTAKVVPERNGPGEQMIGYLTKNLGYGNVWFQRNERSIDQKMTKTYGWNPTRMNKRAAMEEYKTALHQGTIVNRSESAVRCCQNFILMGHGGVNHSKTITPVSAEVSEKNHGDVTIADMLACHEMKGDSQFEAQDVQPEEIPANCMAYREMQAELEKNRPDLY